MTIEQFNEFRRTTPFVPFAIHLADGRSFPVRHPDAAMLSRSGRTVQVMNADRLIEIVDMLLVISLRPLNKDELKNRR